MNEWSVSGTPEIKYTPGRRVLIEDTATVLRIDNVLIEMALDLR